VDEQVAEEDVQSIPEKQGCAHQKSGMLPAEFQGLICINWVCVEWSWIEEKLRFARLPLAFCQEDTLTRHKPDREFDPDRNGWLCKHHRQPLPGRFEAIFGEAGIPLLKELRGAYKKSEGPINEQWQLNARKILRACAQIPASGNGMGRRIAYLRACIVKMTPPFSADASEKYDPELSPLEAIARKEHSTTEAIWPRFWKFHEELFKLFQLHWPDNSERVERRVHGIVTNAATKNHPLRYLARVLQNERAERRRDGTPGRKWMGWANPTAPIF
jgi:hypothetical protein